MVCNDNCKVKILTQKGRGGAFMKFLFLRSSYPTGETFPTRRLIFFFFLNFVFADLNGLSHLSRKGMNMQPHDLWGGNDSHCISVQMWKELAARKEVSGLSHFYSAICYVQMGGWGTPQRVFQGNDLWRNRRSPNAAPLTLPWWGR